MKDTNSCHSWLFKYTIVAALAILVSACAGTPPKNPPAAEPIEVFNDEAENDVPMDGSPIEFDNTYKPPPTGIPGLKGKKFRAVTYNLHLWGKLKDKPQAKKTVLVKKAGVATLTSADEKEARLHAKKMLNDAFGSVEFAVMYLEDRGVKLRA
jgi:hypothetical protein